MTNSSLRIHNLNHKKRHTTYPCTHTHSGIHRINCVKLCDTERVLKDVPSTLALLVAFAVESHAGLIRHNIYYTDYSKERLPARVLQHEINFTVTNTRNKLQNIKNYRNSHSS